MHTSLSQALSQPSKAIAQTLLARANSGSCALVAFHDSASSTLKIANVGDSRAILGRPTSTTNESGEQIYEVIQLSNDHNGFNAAEVARLNALHPDEELWSKEGYGRFIGWGCARAFGDGRTKWAKDVQEKLRDEYLGTRPAKTLITPPYFTAEPEITSFKVKEGDILIMASDGLWECLSNEETVGLVGKWAQLRSSNSSQSSPSELTFEPTTLPVHMTSPPEASDDDKFTRFKQWNTPKTFTFSHISTDSPAEHLLRNALGGANEDLREALLSIKGSRARSWRDDISISVVIF